MYVHQYTNVYIERFPGKAQLSEGDLYACSIVVSGPNTFLVIVSWNPVRNVSQRLKSMYRIHQNSTFTDHADDD